MNREVTVNGVVCLCGGFSPVLVVLDRERDCIEVGRKKNV